MQIMQMRLHLEISSSLGKHCLQIQRTQDLLIH